MCQVNKDEKIMTIHIMLSGHALFSHLSYAKQYQTYEDTTNALHLWYNRADNKARIVTK